MLVYKCISESLQLTHNILYNDDAQLVMNASKFLLNSDTIKSTSQHIPFMHCITDLLTELSNPVNLMNANSDKWLLTLRPSQPS